METKRRLATSAHTYTCTPVYNYIEDREEDNRQPCKVHVRNSVSPVHNMKQEGFQTASSRRVQYRSFPTTEAREGNNAQKANKKQKKRLQMGTGYSGYKNKTPNLATEHKHMPT